ncbi:hypothetical protein HAX54_006232, partial [Datura stramonium]|nr:hypothetical protein [Datura stramonium]
IHFPTQGAGGYGDAPVQSGGICFPSLVVKVIIKKRRRSNGGIRKKSAYTSQEMGEKDQVFDQSTLYDFGDSIGFDNTIEQNNIGDDTIEPIDISNLGVLVYERGSKRRKTLSVTDDPISAESSLLFDKNDSSKEVADPVTSVEDQHGVIPEAPTQSDIVKFSIEAFNNKVRDPVTSLEEQHLVIPEAETQSHIVKSKEQQVQTVDQAGTIGVVRDQKKNKQKYKSNNVN